DVETTYRSVDEIEAAEAGDPLLVNARRLIETGAAWPDQLRDLSSAIQSRIDDATEKALRHPKLRTADEIVGPLAPYDEEKSRSAAQVAASPGARAEFFGKLPEHVTAPTKRTMAAHINSALADEMLRFPEIIVF